MQTMTQFAHGPGADGSGYHLLCPTCWSGPEGRMTDMSAHGGEPTAICPTCGVESVEWGLAVATDALVIEFVGYQRVADALRDLG